MTSPQPPTPIKTPPISILFVCLGNICRSPLAEAAFRSLLESLPADVQAQIASVDSAGTAAYHAGSALDPRTMATLAAHKVTGYTHRARKVVGADFERFDYILAMDVENLGDLLEARQAYLARRTGSEGKGVGEVVLYGDFGGKLGEVVVDPYYGGGEGFERAYEQVGRFGRGFLMKVLGVDVDTLENDDECGLQGFI